MVAGNIPGKTQTLPTAIYLAVGNGDTQLAWEWTGTVVLFSWILLVWLVTVEETVICRQNHKVIQLHL